jgi:hypothetical protein
MLKLIKRLVEAEYACTLVKFIDKTAYDNDISFVTLSYITQMDTIFCNFKIVKHSEKMILQVLASLNFVKLQ